MSENVENKVYDLDLDSETFASFKIDFNAILKAMLHGMQKNGAENGEISISMKVGVEEKEVVDRGYQRTANVPSFEHKITSKMQFKNEKKGSLSGDYELCFDEATGKYYIKPISSGQMSFFDTGDVAEECIDAGEIIDIDSDEAAITGAERLMLTENDDSSDDDDFDLDEADVPY